MLPFFAKNFLYNILRLNKYSVHWQIINPALINIIKLIDLMLKKILTDTYSFPVPEYLFSNNNQNND